MGDFFSAAKVILGVASSMVAQAGHEAHRTAVDNARTALAAANRRAAERREVEAVFTALARADRPPLDPKATYVVKPATRRSGGQI